MEKTHGNTLLQRKGQNAVNNKLIYFILALSIITLILLEQNWVLHQYQNELLKIISEQNTVISNLQTEVTKISYLLQAALRDIDSITSQVTIWQEMQAHPPGGLKK